MATLCDACDRHCNEGIPLSGTCPNYTGGYTEYEYMRMPEPQEFSTERNVTPREFGMGRRHNHKRRRR